MPTSWIQSIWFNICFCLAVAILLISVSIFFNIPNPTLVSLSVTIIIFMIEEKIKANQRELKAKKSETDELNYKLKDLATKEFVNDGDKHNRELLEEHIRASGEYNKLVLNTVNNIDKKVTELLSRK